LVVVTSTSSGRGVIKEEMKLFINALGSFINKNRLRYASAAFFLILSDLLTVLIPVIVGFTINQITSNTLTWEMLYLITGALFLIACGKYILNYAWVYLFVNGGNKLKRELKVDLFRNILRFDSHLMKRFKVGDLMTRSTSDLQQISTAAGEGIFLLIESTVYFILIFSMMVVIAG